jgi:transcriptional regulator CtsR
MATIKTAVQTLVKEFSDDNLTSYQKENDYLNRTSRAILCSSMCYSLNSQLKYLNSQLLQIQSDLSEAVDSSNNSDTHDAFIQSKLDQIDMTEITVNELAECFEVVKSEFKATAQEDWKASVPGDKIKEKQAKMVTGSRITALLKLKNRGVTLSDEQTALLSLVNEQAINHLESELEHEQIRNDVLINSDEQLNAPK